ncbi:MAG: hypothetical protein A3D67_02245 [Candidatus Lloydbacteria bacterium RIFCSPHIGHO2_02_FULL_51_22]|uniref:Uncharacterized protein n=3 Tax=Candidatus Lloydiibacteriota TaxID=1817910 RepID=A0A1G2DAL0_9BACT|nr:MAG: hypothetical protein A3D67_02245 [Candidatus Lloydbacteria bacterium RIFCSPHIGHO2_02_FULL_51_22]OGZ14047.1 MAG: hypothetical protein A3J08_03925 [Candidatus Lloydbacteria bacterium RIFCSPLOWO2_02_FULL_51_11]OGZ16884.1 MAG: hypothetical protein A3G11_01445 [Candidatus Lloydbacteria bacterium RIFCSPLOWO2_12_FULL_51_9]
MAKGVGKTVVFPWRKAGRLWRALENRGFPKSEIAERPRGSNTRMLPRGIKHREGSGTKNYQKY